MGKKHDKKIADENAIAYPPGATLGKDTGFQGYDSKGVLNFQPKKPKGKELSAANRWLNEITSSARVSCKYHCRCQALSDRQRCFPQYQRRLF